MSRAVAVNPRDYEAWLYTACVYDRRSRQLHESATKYHHNAHHPENRRLFDLYERLFMQTAVTALRLRPDDRLLELRDMTASNPYLTVDANAKCSRWSAVAQVFRRLGKRPQFLEALRRAVSLSPRQLYENREEVADTADPEISAILLLSERSRPMPIRGPEDDYDPPCERRLRVVESTN